MSVGNLKTYGGKGTNMPWQLKMLFGQECACDNLAQIVSNTSAVSRTPNYIRISTSGTIADVTYSFSIANVGTANGTFLGATIKPGEVLELMVLIILMLLLHLHLMEQVLNYLLHIIHNTIY